MRRTIAVLLGLTLLASCGGDSTQPVPPPPPPPNQPPPPPPPPPPPAPVATVSVEPGTVTLVPEQTSQLAATAKDQAGGVLTGRTIAWSSSAPAVASVSTTGLVTALAAGTTTITATSEGKSGTAEVTVVDGGVVGPGGGTVVAADGKVTITVPAGAVTSPVTVTATPSAAALDDPESRWLVGGPAYTLGSGGTAFAQPVTVTIAYDANRLPPWSKPEELGLARWDGSAWHPMSEVTVDPIAGTISGKTTGFSDVSPTIELPYLLVTPEEGHVNTAKRSVVLTVDVGELPEERWYHFDFEWSTTGQSGTISWAEGNGAQYTATLPVLPPDGSEVDQVTVTVTAVRWDGSGTETVGSKTMSIKADLKLFIEIAPWSSVVDFGESLDLHAVVRDETGAPVNAQLTGLRYEWDETGLAGNISSQLWSPTTDEKTTYTAKPVSEQQPDPPRGDRVTVKVTQERRVYSGTALDPHQSTIVYDDIGESEGFLEVAPDWHAGRFSIVTTPTGGGACVFAYVYARKIEGATQYELVADGFNDPGGYGTEFRRTFGGAGSGVEEAGSEYRIALDGGCATTPEAIAFRQNLYATRFAGIQVRVKVTTPDD